MADRYYTLHIAGCTRNLPILNVTDKLAIAGFVMLGDVELTDACAQALAKKVPPETDYVLTAETKGIPLAEELARTRHGPLHRRAQVGQGVHGERALGR